MSEFATSLRPPSGPEDLDPRARPAAPAGHSDALAELARLVGHHDPFRGSAPSTAAVAAPLASEADLSAFESDTRVDPAVTVVAAPPVAVQHPGIDDEPWGRAAPRYAPVSVRAPREPEPSPDVWALGAGEAVEDAEPATPSVAETVDHGRSAGMQRTLVVLAAVVILTGGGLAASFLARPSNTAISGAAATPTILAAAGPSKVQPEMASTAADAPSEPSTLLDKNNNDGTAAATVVNSVEQPVDLAQAVKPASPEVAAEAAPPTSQSAFPEPRKVRTVLVRPDGSVISQSSSAPDGAAQAAADPSGLSFDPMSNRPVAPPPPSAVGASEGVIMPDVPLKPAGKSTARAAKPASTTAQDGSATAQARTPVATPKAKPVARAPASKPKPVAPVVADATPTATTPVAEETAAAATSVGGTFAVQLGAAPSEAEGKSTATRLATKYGVASPAVIKADSKGKTVYRIRLGNLSQEAAQALCAKVQGAGGGCFVVRN